MRWNPLAAALLAAPIFAQETDNTKSDPYRLEPDHEATPYSAAEIREGCPNGRVTVYRMESADGQRALQVFYFRDADEEGTELEVVYLTPDAKKELKRGKNRSKWTDLQRHASFPKEQTTRSEGRVKTPAGTFDCWKYLVIEKTDGATAEKRYAFAKNLAGPPVSVTMTVDGKTQFEMMMVEHRDGTEGSWLKTMGFRGGAGASDAQQASYAADFAKMEKPEGTEAEYVKARVHEAEATKIFNAMDTDADGELTREEFLRGARIPEVKSASRAFDRLDHDADGALAREEFVEVTGGWTD